MKDKIKLHNMVFYAFHGVSSEEKSSGQRFMVDLEMSLDLRQAGISDNLSKTVHYGHVYRMVKTIVEDQNFDLIEALAEKIADRVLKSYGLVETVLVCVKKPQVPIQGMLDYAAVEIVRNRSDG